MPSLRTLGFHGSGGDAGISQKADGGARETSRGGKAETSMIRVSVYLKSFVGVFGQSALMLWIIMTQQLCV